MHWKAFFEENLRECISATVISNSQLFVLTLLTEWSFLKLETRVLKMKYLVRSWTRTQLKTSNPAGCRFLVAVHSKNHSYLLAMLQRKNECESLKLIRAEIVSAVQSSLGKRILQNPLHSENVGAFPSENILLHVKLLPSWGRGIGSPK